MKINYLSEAFKPISKLKQDADKTSTSDNFRNSMVRDKIEPMLNDKQFTHYTTTCCSRFIRARDDYFYNAVINFKYINVDEDAINVTVSLYYPACNTTRASIYPVKELYLMDNVIRECSIEEIHRVIDLNITQSFNAYARKYDPDLLNIATKIHVQKIYLWGNTVEGDSEPAGNLYPLTVKLQSETTFGGTCVLDNLKLKETFEKVNEIFTFCVKDLTLDKYSAALLPIKEDYLPNYILNDLTDKENINFMDEDTLKIYDKMYDDLLSPAMRIYMLSRETLYINLNNYIKTKHIDDNLNKSKNISDSSIFILSKTPLSKLNTIKNEIINASYTNKDIGFLKDVGFFMYTYRWVCKDIYVYNIMLYRYGKFDSSCRLLHKMDI